MSVNFSLPLRWVLAMCLLLGLYGRAPMAAAAEVDLTLVLAVDSSTSVNQGNYSLQIAGLAAAFADPRLHAAIDRGTQRAIAVAVLEWAAYEDTAVSVDWHIITSEGEAIDFARLLATAPRQVMGGVTSLSGAMDSGRALLARAPVSAARRIIDIAGDGRNSDGRPVIEARNDAVAAGIVINGLAITSDVPDLATYYREKVIGGPGSFAMEVADYKGFASGILAKLLREIDGSFLGTDAAPLRHLANRE